MAQFSRSTVPEPINEPLKNYAPGSEERRLLREALTRMASESPEVPCVVGGDEVRTGDVKRQVSPSKHAQVVCTFHQADRALLGRAIESAMAAKAAWEELPFADRAAIFLKAADLLATKYRYEVLAATMLGQGKNVWQAEIDAAAELIDFFRFNVKFAEELYAQQPPRNAAGTWNRSEYRPLEGYVVAVSPFNFTAIGGNLPTAPALMGNVVLWKPASTAVLSNWLVFRVLREAGLPPGVIQFVPGSGAVIGDALFNHRDFAGLHFTGSTSTFNGIMKTTADNLARDLYRAYPRMVGETGGKDFHFVHRSADVEVVVAQTIRGAFEYQGQKCSACSRAYIPDNLWPDVRRRLVEELAKVKMGAVDDFSIFMSAVIDRASFDNIRRYIDGARKSPDCELVAGGGCDDSVGYFVQPTVIATTNPQSTTMVEEIFGPVLTVYVYPAADYEQTLRLCDNTSPYSLTGAVFAADRYAIATAERLLRHAAGNFYINDKSTGAVVGQQPFGGARMSGTNDKAGSALNLLRWVSARSIKENFIPSTTWTYPHMAASE